MSSRLPRSNRRIAGLLRAPMVWIGLALLALVIAATATVGVELFASTSEPMVLNSR